MPAIFFNKWSLKLNKIMHACMLMHFMCTKVDTKEMKKCQEVTCLLTFDETKNERVHIKLTKKSLKKYP